MDDIELNKIRVVGIATRTSHHTENSIKRKIPELWKRFYQERCFDKIPNKVDQKKIYGVYAEYDPDEFGAFTFVLGMEVSDFTEIPGGMIGKTINDDTYKVIESENGPFKEVAPKTWGLIQEEDSIQGSRRYGTDFEVYDFGAEKGKMKVFIGIAS